MEVVAAGRWDRPVPNGEAEYGEFLAACAQGRLLVQECPACGHRQFYPRSLCVTCGAEPGWMEASGLGTVHTFTVVRESRAEPFGREVPYVVAVVDLDEGVRMLGTVTGAEGVEVGLRVRAYAVEYEAGRAIPYWQPVR